MSVLVGVQQGGVTHFEMAGFLSGAQRQGDLRTSGPVSALRMYVMTGCRGIEVGGGKRLLPLRGHYEHVDVPSVPAVPGVSTNAKRARRTCSLPSTET